MGTRADYYIGRGVDAQWLGSTAWDGYPDGMPPELLTAVTEAEFRSVLAGMADTRPDFTIPKTDNWPWPWKDSHLTDYTYAFDSDTVYVSSFGDDWFKATEGDPGHPDDAPYPPKHHVTCAQCGNHAAPAVEYPLRGGKPQGDIFGPRSGVIVLGVAKGTT